MKPNGYWTYEKCEELAKSCKSGRELRKKESGAFYKAYTKGWLKDWFDTRPNSKPSGYWTHEKCEEEAKKYVSYSNFNANNYVVYRKCLKEDWLKDFTWLVNDMGVYDLVTKKYVIYKYVWDDTDTVYVGLTKDLRERDRNHRRIKEKKGKACISIVKKYADSNGFGIPTPIVLEENLDAENARDREDYYVKLYRNNVLNVLNIGKTGKSTGSLGGSLKKWTYDLCYEEAKKYNSRTDFQRSCYGAYRAARKNKWICDYGWLKEKIHNNGYWTYDHCLEEASKYSSRKEFRENSRTCYSLCCRYKFIDKINKELWAH
jgi:hypothetical protein